MGKVIDWLTQGGGIGNFIVIVGQPHSGKTTILCNIFKTALQNDFEIITTTRIFNPPKKFHIVNSASTLFQAYAKCESKALIAPDDAQSSFDSTSMASTKGSRMNQSLYLFMAKIQANFIYVAHYIEKVPKPIIDCGPLVIFATEPGKMMINRVIYEVPNTPFKFPKAFIPSWRWDINPDDLYDSLSKIKGKNNDDIIQKNKKGILEFLENPKDSGIPKKTEIELVLRRFKDDLGKDIKLTQKYIADKFEVDPGYITRIKKTL